jgi:hypothetical protein
MLVTDVELTIVAHCWRRRQGSVSGERPEVRKVKILEGRADVIRIGVFRRRLVSSTVKPEEKRATSRFDLPPSRIRTILLQ